MTTKTIAASEKKREAAVEAAIDKLEQDGLPVTVKNVQSLTGGSNRDLLGPIRAVKARREAQRAAAAATPPVPTDLSDLAEAMWQTAWRMADESAAEARKGYLAERDRLEAEVRDREEVITMLEVEGEEAARRAQTAEAARDALSADLVVALRKLDIALARLDERDALVRLVAERGPAAPADALTMADAAAATKETSHDDPDASDDPPAASIVTPEVIELSARRRTRCDRGASPDQRAEAAALRDADDSTPNLPMIFPSPASPDELPAT